MKMGLSTLRTTVCRGFPCRFEWSSFRDFKWRFLGTWQEGLGTYEQPYTKRRHNVSLMGEATYTLQGEKLPMWMRGVDVRMGIGADFWFSTRWQQLWYAVDHYEAWFVRKEIAFFIV